MSYHDGWLFHTALERCNIPQVGPLSRNLIIWGFMYSLTKFQEYGSSGEHGLVSAHSSSSWNPLKGTGWHRRSTHSISKHDSYTQNCDCLLRSWLHFQVFVSSSFQLLECRAVRKWVVSTCFLFSIHTQFEPICIFLISLILANSGCQEFNPYEFATVSASAILPVNTPSFSFAEPPLPWLDP